MENASKALLMAGGILIALLVIGTLVLMFTELGDFQNSQNDVEKEAQIAKFNNQYMPYEKDNLTIMELKTVYNKVKSHNSKNPEMIIEFIDDGLGVLDNNGRNTNVIILLEGSFSNIDEEHKMNGSYKCTGITYSDDGYINRISFQKN